MPFVSMFLILVSTFTTLIPQFILLAKPVTGVKLLFMMAKFETNSLPNLPLISTSQIGAFQIFSKLIFFLVPSDLHLVASYPSPFTSSIHCCNSTQSWFPASSTCKSSRPPYKHHLLKPDNGLKTKDQIFRKWNTCKCNNSTWPPIHNLCNCVAAMNPTRDISTPSDFLCCCFLCHFVLSLPLNLTVSPSATFGLFCDALLSPSSCNNPVAAYSLACNPSLFSFVPPIHFAQFSALLNIILKNYY